MKTAAEERYEQHIGLFLNKTDTKVKEKHILA